MSKTLDAAGMSELGRRISMAMDWADAQMKFVLHGDEPGSNRKPPHWKVLEEHEVQELKDILGGKVHKPCGAGCKAFETGCGAEAIWVSLSRIANYIGMQLSQGISIHREDGKLPGCFGLAGRIMELEARLKKLEEAKVGDTEDGA